MTVFNRHFKQLRIRGVPYLGKQTLPFRGYSKYLSSINVGKIKELLETFVSIGPIAVSYTHLDVYKRQIKGWTLFLGQSLLL